MKPDRGECEKAITISDDRQCFVLFIFPRLLSDRFLCAPEFSETNRVMRSGAVFLNSCCAESCKAMLVD